MYFNNVTSGIVVLPTLNEANPFPTVKTNEGNTISQSYYIYRGPNGSADPSLKYGAIFDKSSHDVLLATQAVTAQLYKDLDNPERTKGVDSQRVLKNLENLRNNFLARLQNKEGKENSQPINNQIDQAKTAVTAKLVGNALFEQALSSTQPG